MRRADRRRIYRNRLLATCLTNFNFITARLMENPLRVQQIRFTFERNSSPAHQHVEQYSQRPCHAQIIPDNPGCVQPSQRRNSFLTTRPYLRTCLAKDGLLPAQPSISLHNSPSYTFWRPWHNALKLSHRAECKPIVPSPSFWDQLELSY